MNFKSEVLNKILYVDEEIMQSINNIQQGHISIKEFIKNFVEITKLYIKKYEQYSELTGVDKKKRVDDIILIYVETILDSTSLNFILKWLLRKVLISNIPNLTQMIYDLIKTKVEGITE